MVDEGPSQQLGMTPSLHLHEQNHEQRNVELLLKILNNTTTFFSQKTDCLTNENDPHPTLMQRMVFILFTRDEQVDPLVVNCSLNLVNHKGC